MPDPMQTLPEVEPASAPSEIYASIDVGTNSVKMIVADLCGDTRLLWEQSVVTRLGEGMHEQARYLREAPMRRTLDALKEFMENAQQHGAKQVVAVGTAALRDADNREHFRRRAREQAGVEIEVISGEEEARLSYLAVRRDPHWRNQAHLCVIDVGGGSTEIIQGEAHSHRIASRTSVNLGAVKLTEQVLRSDPPTIAQLTRASQIAQEQFAQVRLLENGESMVVGVGGTLTNLACMHLGGFAEAEVLHGHILTQDTLEDQIEHLAKRTIEERKSLPGLDPRRADIILGGAILLAQALARLGSPSLAVSTRGLRWGVLYDRFL
jgi:exopolyphosphatase/guanosine-5'-triphosphate,3'-diphosphate pyrophosphatase